MSSSAGTPVVDTTARYLPFGDWRTEPTADLTDRGYTSHKHNNMGSDDIGLIYMNARYYVPGIARFASADTVVPNPANPQSYNRYSYVFNQPLNYTDPSGHIACEELGTEECDEYGDYVDSSPSPNTGGMPDAALEIVLWVAKQHKKIDLGYILDPARTTPVVFTLYNTDWLCSANLGFCNIMSGAMHLVFMPFGSSPVIGATNQYWEQTFSGWGYYMDIIEMVLIFSIIDGGNLGEVLAGFADLVLAGLACMNAGECYIGQPHASLPTMIVGNQSFMVTATDATLGMIPGVDLFTTWASTAYDSADLLGNVPNYYSYGISLMVAPTGQIQISAYHLIYLWS